jgi:rare lipoprotein A
MNRQEIVKLRSLVGTSVVAAALMVLGAVQTARSEEGIAVHYSDRFQGKPTANGDKFDQEGLTAAHNKLPFGTKVKVTNLENKKSVELTINDRMAQGNRNVIDVTRRAARELAFGKKGQARVRVDVVQ